MLKNRFSTESEDIESKQVKKKKKKTLLQKKYELPETVLFG